MSMGDLRYTTDTSATAMEVQLDCLRRMSPRERIQKTVAMSTRLRNMALDAIRRRHPELADAEVRLMFIEHTYGKTLADGIRQNRSESVR